MVHHLPENTKELEQLIRQCGKSKLTPLLHRITSHITSTQNNRISNTYLANLLIQAYGRCNRLRDGRRVFEHMSSKNVFSWNIMIAAYAQNGLLPHAQLLFDLMPVQNAISWNTMITVYAQHSDLPKAKYLFDSMPCRDAVSWTAMITAYARSRQFKRAIVLFKLMDLEGVTPTELTLIVVLEACTTLVLEGKNIHACALDLGVQSNVMVATALLDMYAKLGDFETCRQVFGGMPERNIFSWNAMLGAYFRNGRVQEAEMFFEGIPERDVVSWNSLVGAYAQFGHRQKAVLTFQRMETECVTPNIITFVNLLACVDNLLEVKAMHRITVRAGLHCEVKLATALVEAYTRCGSLHDSRRMFDTMVTTDTIVWNVLLSACACLGKSREAIRVFQLMNLEGLNPNDLTFTVVLSVCSHAGLLEESLVYFELMISGCGIAASEEHYHCMVDLFGRVGWVGEAQDMFQEMPDNITWTSLVAASKLHCSK